MAFGTATVTTSVGKANIAARLLGTTPATNEAKYIAAGTGATAAARTAAIGDTALSAELTEGRVAGTGSIVTTAVTNDTAQEVGTITATGARAIDESGLFTASTAGTMVTSATFPVVNLANGDSIQFTWKIQVS